MELIRRFATGQRIPVYIQADGGYAGRVALLLPRIQVYFYDDNSDPRIREVCSAEDAVAIVRQRYPSVHFRDGLGANDIVPDPHGIDPNDYFFGFEFYPNAAAVVRSEMQSAESLAVFTAGVVKWFVKLGPLIDIEGVKP